MAKNKGYTIRQRESGKLQIEISNKYGKYCRTLPVGTTLQQAQALAQEKLRLLANGASVNLRNPGQFNETT
jgi:hypothetical protein